MALEAVPIDRRFLPRGLWARLLQKRGTLHLLILAYDILRNQSHWTARSSSKTLLMTQQKEAPTQTLFISDVRYWPASGVRSGPFAATSLAGAATADGEAAIVTTVRTAKLNVKKYPVSSRRSLTSNGCFSTTSYLLLRLKVHF
jgi:hypothetical protein